MMQKQAVEEHYQKKSYKLFIVWLSVYVLVMVLYCLFPHYPGFAGPGKIVGILTCGALDLLFLLIFLTESIYWIGGVTYEEAAAAGAKARKKYALRHLLLFLAATGVYLYYCFGNIPFFNTNTIKDALTAAGVVCAAVLVSIKIHL